ncbi:MAG TPA: FAD-binding domain-containing protein, partial [Chroococcales cyanobacterium]
KEIGWREFAYHILHNFPATPDEPLQKKFDRFPWSNEKDSLKAWQKGATGYPIVDAGMRQLWHIGWMHNRVRMIVASFLTKDLLISWHHGARWFWDTLVDADLANNTLGWQWAGGCGADAAPYFRIFNPELQGEKFDPRGEYVKRWVPELAQLPDKWIHKPWKAPPAVLNAANIELGKDYPLPLVEHARARQRALAAFAHIKSDAL